MQKRYFPAEERERRAALWRDHTPQELRRLLPDVHPTSLVKQARRYGWTRSPETLARMAEEHSHRLDSCHQRVFTPAEEELMERLWREHTPPELKRACSRAGILVANVYHRARQYGWKRSADTLARMAAEERERRCRPRTPRVSRVSITAEQRARRAQTMRRVCRLDAMLIAGGEKPLSRIAYSALSGRQKAARRYACRRYGYFSNPDGDALTLFYDDLTARAPSLEAKYAALGFSFSPAPTDDTEKH